MDWHVGTQSAVHLYFRPRTPDVSIVGAGIMIGYDIGKEWLDRREGRGGYILCALEWKGFMCSV
jgi:hypothetical protein